MAARVAPPDHAPFASLPVTTIAVDGGADRIAVHVSGRLESGRVPLICIAGYQRNMADYSAFLPLFRSAAGEDWPVVLVDLRGRGRSSDRAHLADYASPNDARDVDAVATALAIESALMVGQGYGGQVTMMLAARRPRLIAATVLIDSGPVNDPRGLVRLRTNLQELDTLRGEAAFRRISRQILAVDYPELSEARLDGAALRTHFVNDKGAVRPLFDPRLIKLLEPFDLDDVLVAQWQLFRALGHAPMLLMRTQYTEQLRRTTFEEMLRQRRDAEGYEIEHQGSPALLDTADDVAPIAEFARDLTKWRGAFVSPPEP
jgi:pimeloyl-ACP methyl ester carboxylesterase